jgi:hypothetical protein
MSVRILSYGLYRISVKSDLWFLHSMLYGELNPTHQEVQIEVRQILKKGTTLQWIMCMTCRVDPIQGP